MKALAGLIPLLATACTFLPRPTPVPVRAQIHEPATDTRELVVLIPGRHSLPSEFECKGFVTEVRESRPNARIVIPDLHLGYYRNRSATDRLHEDVILPATAEGLNRVTLIGISMGGLGAMLYDLEYPGHADEIILLSPFLGDASVIEDITAQGGLSKWQPQGEDPDEFSRRLWTSLRDKWLPRANRPPLRLGCGESDRLAPATRLAASELGPAETVWLPGDHDWPTWNALIGRID